jgi:transcriptional regulator with GAF, ATPase, and Fis domain
MDRGNIIQKFLDLLSGNDSSSEYGVCGNDAVALAGTGGYKFNIGKLRPKTYLAEVIKSGQMIVLERRGSSERCRKCINRRDCPYRSVIFCPIKECDVVKGAVYMMSSQPLTNNIDEAGSNIQTISSILSTLSQENITNLNWKANSHSILDKRHRHPIGINRNGLIERSKDSTFGVYPGIITISENIKNLINKCQIIAKKDSTVLLTGETGAGKELFVHMIHKLSLRKSKPLVVVNCGSIPENLLESEFFGYVCGAFTGAASGGKKGKFELANGGTIFLDEIGDLPLPLQAKLLRVLENKTIDKLGSSESTKIDVRIIAATNRDLESMTKEETFRKDLFYRINVMRVKIPPLRERREDIALLASHFLNYFHNESNTEVVINENLLRDLTEYEWPGNIRELKNIMEYGAVFSKKNILNYQDLPDDFKQALLTNASNINLETNAVYSFKQKSIVKALSLYGNSTKAKKEIAKKLGISLATLYRDIKRFDLHNVSK